MSTTPTTLPTIVDALQSRAAEAPQRRAYEFLPDDAGEPTTLSYGELARAADAVAAQLLERCERGDRAILVYPPGLEFVVAFLGCLRAGVVAVPVHAPRDVRSLRKLAQVAGDCSARLLLTGGEIADVVGEQAAQLFAGQLHAIVTTLEQSASIDWVPPREPSADEVAFLQYTSGSTAFPKGVVVRHRHLSANLAMIRTVWAVSENDVFVSWLPVFHDAGLISVLLSALWSGASCVQMSPLAFLKDPPRWLREITRHRATLSGGPNFAFDLALARLSRTQEEELDLSSLRVLFNGAEPIRASTLERFSARLRPRGFDPSALTPGYGMAEAVVGVSSGPLGSGMSAKWVDGPSLEGGRVVAVDRSDPGARGIVSCGVPLDQVDLRIVDPTTCQQCEPESVGEVWVSSPTVTGEYWSKPEESAATFGGRIAGTGEGPFLRTGDLGFMHDGQVYVTGRAKDLVILRGRNYYPQDIELTVQECHPALRPSCVAAFALDTPGGEQLAILQEVKREASDTDPEALVKQIRRAVSEAHEIVPGCIVLLRAGSILKTSSGKIQRRPNRDAFLRGELDVLHVWRADGSADDAARPTSTGAKGDAAAEGPSPPRPEGSWRERRDRRQLADWLRSWLERRLGVRAAEVDPYQDFSELGLDSLAMAELVSELEGKLGFAISDNVAWSNPTVNLLASYLTEQKTMRGPDAAPSAGASGPNKAPTRKKLGVLEGSLVSFFVLPGDDLLDRVTPFYEWQEARRRAGVWPYSKAVQGHSAPVAEVANDSGVVHEGINLATIDYLGLARHPQVIEAAQRAIRDHGVHSASTGILQGNSPLSLELERVLAEMFRSGSTLLFPTGWGAGFGSVTALVRPDDYVLMDLLGHACLQTGARYATRNVIQYGHLDVEHARTLLQEIRSRDTKNGILVVTEGLYSMDSDWPDIARLQEVCHEFGARMLIDVAHDIASFGPEGTGQIGVQGALGKIDLVMGGFSKSLAANGGFLVLPTEAAKQYAKVFAGSHMFSSGLSPIAAAVATAAIGVSRSAEGDERRRQVMRNVEALRAAFRGHGLSCMGEPSPIVPVLVGSEGVGRVASKLIAERGVNASLIEHPAVPIGAARFRMQLTPDHTVEQMRTTASVVASALGEARSLIDSGAFATS